MGHRTGYRRKQTNGSIGFTRRERDVLAYLMCGNYGDREIAERLKIGERTVRHHASSIYSKLGVRGRAEAIAVYGRRMWV